MPSAGHRPSERGWLELLFDRAVGLQSPSDMWQDDRLEDHMAVDQLVRIGVEQVCMRTHIFVIRPIIRPTVMPTMSWIRQSPIISNNFKNSWLREDSDD